MVEDVNVSRRSMLKNIGAVVAGVTGTVALGATLTEAVALRTPPQPEGPFYPVKDQLDKDADLTVVSGHTKSALGERILLTGQVVDAATLQPLPNTVVEFWQACASGRYNHPRDPNTAPLDPDFQYWAQVRAGEEGEFRVKTIMPGAYPADPNWMRPPHIHVKVHRPGYPSLTTQIYFAGNPLNDTDQILQQLSPEQRALVVVDLKAGEDAILTGKWTIYLARRNAQSLRETPELD